MQKKTNYQVSRTSEGRWLCSDLERGLLCTWENRKFNDTQDYQFSGDITSPEVLASLSGEMAEYLLKYHTNKVLNPKEIEAYEASLPPEEFLRKDIGAQIKQWRKVRGLTLEQLAQECGLSKQHINRIEQGRYNVTIDTLASILEALGIWINLGE